MEQRAFVGHFPENTANTPNINWATVPQLTQKYFWSSVPQRYHLTWSDYRVLGREGEWRTALWRDTLHWGIFSSLKFVKLSWNFFLRTRSCLTLIHFYTRHYRRFSFSLDLRKPNLFLIKLILNTTCLMWSWTKPHEYMPGQARQMLLPGRNQRLWWSLSYQSVGCVVWGLGAGLCGCDSTW